MQFSVVLEKDNVKSLICLIYIIIYFSLQFFYCAFTTFAVVCHAFAEFVIRSPLIRRRTSFWNGERRTSPANRPTSPSTMANVAIHQPRISTNIYAKFYSRAFFRVHTCSALRAFVFHQNIILFVRVRFLFSFSWGRCGKS